MKRMPNSDLIDPALLERWKIGLEGLRLFQWCCPELLKHIPHWPVTETTLLRVCAVLLLKVTEQLGPLVIFSSEASEYIEWFYIRYSQDLAAALHAPFQEDEEYISLEDFSSCMHALVPEGCGVGLSAFYDGEEDEQPSLLLGSLWYLFWRTSWDTGIRIMNVSDTANMARVLNCEALPAHTDMEQLRERLQIAEWPYATRPGELLAYAVERCKNPLANIQNGLSCHGDFQEFPWDEVHTLFGLLPEAEQIRHDFMALEACVADEPHYLQSLITQVQEQAACYQLPQDLSLFEVMEVYDGIEEA